MSRDQLTVANTSKLSFLISLHVFFAAVYHTSLYNHIFISRQVDMAYQKPYCYCHYHDTSEIQMGKLGVYKLKK